MATEVSPSRIAHKFSDIVRRVKARLVEVSGVDESKVWIVSVPDEELADYLAQPGILIRVRPPVPAPTPGAGRLAYLTQRRLEVYRVTVSMLDPGGKDDASVLAHLDAEDDVPNALANDGTITKLIHWVPGSQDAARKVDTNKGLLVSSFFFDVLYVPPLPVSHDVTPPV